MYKLLNDTFTNQTHMVFRLIDKTYIPINPDNTDYQAYLLWLEEGNTPLPAENT
jgi:hypothetical protein